MTELELLKVIGYAQDMHILDANETPVKSKIIPFKKPSSAIVRTIAAILTVILAVSLFLQTPVGVAAAEAVKTQFERFLDILFPPKDTVMYIEGVPETVHVEAQGREPEIDVPGFSIYVDAENYTMTEENGSWFIRPIDASPDLPPIEMQITEILDKSPIETAEKTSAKIAEEWDDISNIWTYRLNSGAEVLTINASEGMKWDSVQEDHQFISNLQGGCYHVVIRYFMEASEGAGFRLHNMLKSFTIVAPQDISQYNDEADTLVKAMEREIAYAQEQDQWQSETSDPEMVAMERNNRWLDTHRKLWEILQRSADAETIQNLMADQLNWGTQKRYTIDSLSLEDRAAREEESAAWVKERCLMLLHYLDGSAALTPRDPGITLSPKAAVDDFVAAYFREDMQTIEKYLLDSYSEQAEIYTTGQEDIVAIKGLDHIPQDMARYGRLNASAEFCSSPESDSYDYLSISLVWEYNHWAVDSYSLEK